MSGLSWGQYPSRVLTHRLDSLGDVPGMGQSAPARSQGQFTGGAEVSRGPYPYNPLDDLVQGYWL